MTHPDRFAGASDRDIALAQEEFVRVGQARDVLLSAGFHRAQPKTQPPQQPQPPRPAPKPKPEPPRTRPQPGPSKPAAGQSPPAPKRAPAAEPQAKKSTGMVVAGLAIIVTGFAVAIALLLSAQPTPSNNSDPGMARSLLGTTWSGIDSEGVDTKLSFFANDMVGVTWDGESYLDPADTWSVDADGEVEITFAFTDGTGVYRGTYYGRSSPIFFDIDFPGGSATLTAR